MANERERGQMRCVLVAVVSAMIWLAGCAKVSVPVGDGKVEVKPVRALTDAEKFALLRDEAAKRGLHWKIVCTTEYADEKENYLAVAAWSKASLSAVYVEDGLTDEWMQERSTQADAAFALFQSIQGEPTHPVAKWGRSRYSNDDAARKRRTCPPEITSDSLKAHEMMHDPMKQSQADSRVQKDGGER